MTNVAAIQMASGPQPQANMLEARRLLKDAVDKGARLAVLPENFAMMGMQDGDILKIAEEPDAGPLQAFLADQARRLGIWLVGGTVPLRGGRGDRARPACLVYDDQGQRVARYDKMHLFDVRIPDGDEHYAESAIFESGDHIVTLDTPFGRMGLAVCYDLRFPELFRGLLDQGAEFVAMPAAFTAQTGQAHWDVLLRARAIENQMFVLAAAQGGFHVNGRETYGHSALVDPWGRVVAQLGRNPGVLVADLSCDCVGRIRTLFPAVHHRRLSCEVQVPDTGT
jgi:deaminated glutathione amidase